MFSKSSDPVEDSGEADGGKKGGGGFIIASGEAAQSLGPLEKVFDLMALAIPAAMKRQGMPAICLGRNADSTVLLEKEAGQRVAIISLIPDDDHRAQALKQFG